MSKVLKFIVHFVVICMILCVIALAVPPFFGITTEIQDDSASKTNLALGSVTYAIPVRSGELRPGDPLLVTEDASVYRYNVAGLDLENGRGTVIDPTVTNAQPITVAIRDYAPKIVLTVPFIGYLMMATQSIEGLIILGLAIVFLIILYVIAELWKRSPDSDDDFQDTERGYVKSAKELRREEQRRQRELDREADEIRREEKLRRKSRGGKIRTGGFIDEVDESDLVSYQEPVQETVTEQHVQSATSEAHELLRKEIKEMAAATAQEDVMDLPVVEEEPEYTPSRSSRRKSASPYANSVSPAVPEEDEEPVELRKLAIPRRSANDLAQEARARGDKPDVIRDDVTDVTLFDYSDLFAEVEAALNEGDDF